MPGGNMSSERAVSASKMVPWMLSPKEDKPCVLTWQKGCKNNEHSPSSPFIGALLQSMKDPPSWLNHFLKTQLLILLHWPLNFFIQIWGKGHIQTLAKIKGDFCLYLHRIFYNENIFMLLMKLKITHMNNKTIKKWKSKKN
jgi:hypothetical protein